MNILLLIDNLGSGGAQRQIVTLGILLNNFQQNVTILTYSEGGFFKQDVQNNGINHYYCKASNLFSRILKVRKFIRHGKYDVVISFMDVPNFLNNFAAIGGKSWKVITSERSSNISTFESMKGKIFSIFQRFSDFMQNKYV